MSDCFQCKKTYMPAKTNTGCPKCAPGVIISEIEFMKPIKIDTVYELALEAGAATSRCTGATRYQFDKISLAEFERLIINKHFKNPVAWRATNFAHDNDVYPWAYRDFEAPFNPPSAGEGLYVKPKVE